MPRSGRIKKRTVKTDSVYNSILVQKFINRIMVEGKKSLAERIFYTAIRAIEEKEKKPALEIFEKVIKNVSPIMEVKSRRVGGATYQVPIEVTRERGQAIAMKWLREAALERPGKSMTEKLSQEMLDAYKGVGGAMKKKEDLHKSAEANRAFAHFRW